MATLAPGVTLWDSGEFLAAIHSLGIPHPPGTPLYILIGRVWTFVAAPLFGFARSVNLLSAAATACACATLTSLVIRWTGDRVAATGAGITAGLMSTVWLNATETEVYALAFLMGCLILAAANRAGEDGDVRWALLVAYLIGLGWSLHLSALVVVPGALVLMFTGRDGYMSIPSGRRRSDGRRQRQGIGRVVALCFLLSVVGATAILFMLVRARHDPRINQGNPSTLHALMEVLQRRQYFLAPLWPRQSPVYLQLGNLFEYADWQFALGLDDEPGPGWVRTPLTIVYAMLGAYGSIAHRAANRRSWRAMVTLVATATLGVIVYLNLKAGPSYGAGILPVDAVHEARERDYFFFVAFACWGLWAGYGAVRIARAVSPRLELAGLAVAALPAFTNWNAIAALRSGAQPDTREQAVVMLSAVPRRGVFLAFGDNDTYPIWYLQEVEGVRRDVTVVTIPLLSAAWYRAELARRYRLLDSRADQHWLGDQATRESVTSHAAALGRSIANSPSITR